MHEGFHLDSCPDFESHEPRYVRGNETSYPPPFSLWSGKMGGGLAGVLRSRCVPCFADKATQNERNNRTCRHSCHDRNAMGSGRVKDSQPVLEKYRGGEGGYLWHGGFEK